MWSSMKKKFLFKIIFIPYALLDIFSDKIFPLLVSPTTHSLIPSQTHATLISIVLPTSTQVWQPSSHLQDYHCSSITIKPSFATCHPLSHVLSYHQLSPSYQLFVDVLSSSSKPITYSQTTLFQSGEKLWLWSCKLLRVMVLGHWLIFLLVNML